MYSVLLPNGVTAFFQPHERQQALRYAHLCHGQFATDSVMKPRNPIDKYSVSSATVRDVQFANLRSAQLYAQNINGKVKEIATGRTLATDGLPIGARHREAALHREIRDLIADAKRTVARKLGQDVDPKAHAFLQHNTHLRKSEPHHAKPIPYLETNPLAHPDTAPMVPGSMVQTLRAGKDPRDEMPPPPRQQRIPQAQSIAGTSMQPAGWRRPPDVRKTNDLGMPRDQLKDPRTDVVQQAAPATPTGEPQGTSFLRDATQGAANKSPRPGLPFDEADLDASISKHFGNEFGKFKKQITPKPEQQSPEQQNSAVAEMVSFIDSLQLQGSISPEQRAEFDQLWKNLVVVGGQEQRQQVPGYGQGAYADSVAQDANPWYWRDQQQKVANWASRALNERNGVHCLEILGMDRDSAKAMIRSATFASISPAPHIDVAL